MVAVVSGRPRLIMTDDADTEISCFYVKYLIYNKIIIYFSTVFPRSRHLLCVWHVANAVHYRVSPQYLAEKEWL